MRFKIRPVLEFVLLGVLITNALAIDPGSIDEQIALTYGKPQARKALERQCIETLSGDAEQAEKERACRILQMIGTTEAIDALAALLPDEKLSHFARKALEPMPYPQAGAALRAVLPKAAGNVKIGIIHSLGVRRDAQAVGILVPLLKDADTQIAAAAAWALGRTATPQAVEALAKFRAEAPPALGAAAADASLIAAEQLLASARSRQAAEIYAALRATRWPLHVRLGAFTGLLEAEPAGAEQRLLQAINGSDELLRRIAIDKVATIKGQGLGRRFAKQLPRLEPEAQVLLIRALTRRGEPGVREAVTLAASSSDPAVRLAATEALGSIGNASSVGLLAAMVDHGSDEQQVKTAAASLRRLRGDGVDAEIIKAVNGAGAAGRARLIGILRDRQAKDAVGTLLQQARAGDPAVRKAAFKALADLAEPKDLPALVKLLIELKIDELRGDAERAVAMVSRRILEQSHRADEVLSALSAPKGLAADAKSSLLRVLQGIGTSEAFQAVRQAVKDKSAAVKDAAVRALAEWPTDQAVDALLEFYGTTKSETLRVVALRGCVRLLGTGSRPASETVGACRQLLESARRPDEKKLILGCLANLPDPDALKLVEPMLADKTVRAEAELAMVRVARQVAGSAPGRAKAAAKLLLEKSANPTIRKQAEAVVTLIDKAADYVTAWQVAGPYTKRGRDFDALFDSVFPPEQATAEGVSWRLLTPDGESPRPWMFNLAKSIGGNNRVAYARTWVHSERRQAVRIEYGADDGAKLWVNGKLVHSDAAGGAATPGEYKVNVTLEKGWNSLLLKITQDTGPWEFCLRIRRTDGGPVEGVEVQATPPGD